MPRVVRSAANSLDSTARHHLQLHWGRRGYGEKRYRFFNAVNAFNLNRQPR